MHTCFILDVSQVKQLTMLHAILSQGILLLGGLDAQCCGLDGPCITHGFIAIVSLCDEPVLLQTLHYDSKAASVAAKLFILQQSLGQIVAFHFKAQ